MKLSDRHLMVSVARDMSNWKLAESKIRELVVELKEKNNTLLKLDRIKDDFLSTISHELRTPLTSILGYLKLLNREVGGKLAVDQKDYIETALRNGERLYDLINELLDLSRLESGRMELHMKKVVAADLLEEAVKTTLNLFLIRHVELHVQAPPRDIEVNVDEEKLFRVLVNLLGNAAKFTPERGHVALGAVRHVRNGNEGCLFFVKNDGPGIPEEDLKRIFDKFYRLEAHLRRETSGSGLGLAICTKLVELHGGEIWAENVDTGGAIFKVFLPDAGK
jgi:signal transduction histidine kinase